MARFQKEIHRIKDPELRELTEALTKYACAFYKLVNKRGINNYNIDPSSKFVFGYFEKMSVLQATFLLFQIMIWILLIISYLLITNEKWQLRLMIIPGLIYIFELHHIIKSLIIWNYYPGLITALIFPIIGFLFWKELIKNFD